jgi:aspartate aminotransferase
MIRFVKNHKQKISFILVYSLDRFSRSGENAIFISSELKKQGRNIISLGAGEPDFDTPDNIKESAILAIRRGETKYTVVDGRHELKEAIRNKLKRENGLEYNLDRITVGAGGKQVIYNLLAASLNIGDEVIIPAPYWVSYPDITLLNGGVPVFLECSIEQNFKLTPELLKKSITNKSKWLILNSPSNPTGASYSKEELESIAEIVRAHPSLHVLSDDIYEHIVFDGFKFYNLAQIAPDLQDRVFIVNGVSKAYSMTGWRIGYGAGDSALIKAMSVIQSQTTSNPSSISQAAAIQALNGTQDYIKPNALSFQKKRDLALSILSQVEGLKCYKPEGAFYLFPKCDSFFDLNTPSNQKIRNCNDLAAYFLEYANVAVVPGIAFGLGGYFRISYATSFEELEKGCLSIAEACKALS